MRTAYTPKLSTRIKIYTCKTLQYTIACSAPKSIHLFYCYFFLFFASIGKELLVCKMLVKIYVCVTATNSAACAAGNRRRKTSGSTGGDVTDATISTLSPRDLSGQMQSCTASRSSSQMLSS